MMSETTPHMTAVVIAGGLSQRMKTDKAFLTFGGMRLLDRILSRLTPLFSQVVINSNRPDLFKEWGVPVWPDIYPGKGALGGVYTALTHASTDYIFCVACDMPLLNPRLIAFMQRQIDGCDALVPRTPDGLHPLHAIYSKRCCGVIQQLFQEDCLKISSMFSRVRVQYLTEFQIIRFDPNFESFLNLNTREELRAARQRYAADIRNAR